MSKRTKGNWIYEESNTESESYVIRAEQHGLYENGEVENPSVIIGALDAWDAERVGEQSANARLISAAPMLLLACKSAFCVLSDVMNTASEEDATWQKGGDNYTAMQQLIQVISDADEDSAKFIVESVSK